MCSDSETREKTTTRITHCSLLLAAIFNFIYLIYFAFLRFQIVKATEALNITTAEVRSENQSAVCGAALYRVGMVGVS